MYIQTKIINFAPTNKTLTNKNETFVMERYTQKQLRNLVKVGVAKDVTYASDKKEIPESYTQIGYAAGLYGCNGMLLLGASGQLYAVTSRTSAIYLF